MLLDRVTRAKTLEELLPLPPDPEEPDPCIHRSGLVEACERCCRTPLEDLMAGELQMLIGQKFGEEYLIPLVLERLLVSPWTPSERYGGYLIETVLKGIPVSYWRDHPELARERDRILVRALEEYRRAPRLKKAGFDPQLLAVIQEQVR